MNAELNIPTVSYMSVAYQTYFNRQTDYKTLSRVGIFGAQQGDFRVKSLKLHFPVLAIGYVLKHYKWRNVAIVYGYGHYMNTAFRDTFSNFTELGVIGEWGVSENLNFFADAHVTNTFAISSKEYNDTRLLDAAMQRVKNYARSNISFISVKNYILQ